MGSKILVRTDRISGEYLAGALDEEGIDVQIGSLGDNLSWSSAVERVFLAVPEEQVERAMAVIERVRKEHPRMPLDFTGASEMPPFFGGMG
jgi:hypothetical protein